MAHKVLLVDDHPQGRAVLEEMLLTSGYQVLPASNGDEALRLFGTEKPNLVVTDLNMPGMDGNQLCSEIRQLSSVPILVVTAAIDPTKLDLIAEIHQHSDAFMQKPIIIEEFLQIVESLLAGSGTAN